MNDQKSFEALLRFLDYLKEKGLLKANTANARKASAHKVLSILQPEELIDVTSLDLDDVMQRFANIEGQNYTPDSLTSYKSRLKSALDDFEEYLENPLGFRPQIQTRSRKSKFYSRSAEVENETGKVETENTSSKSISSAAHPIDSLILPIPIRPNLIVRIQGLPYDLTRAEANKISSVVQAMAIDELPF